MLFSTACSSRQASGSFSSMTFACVHESTSSGVVELGWVQVSISLFKLKIKLINEQLKQ